VLTGLIKKEIVGHVLSLRFVIGGGGWYGDRAPQPLGIYVQGLDDDIPVQVKLIGMGNHTQDRRALL
jgi:hypothetical protein